MITTTDFEKREIERHVRSVDARRVLEIGAFQGETTRILAKAIPNEGGRVVVIDPMKWSSEILRNGIARHLSSSFPRIFSMLEVAVEQASYETAFWRNVGGRTQEKVVLFRALSSNQALIDNPDPALASFDVVFIDGDHGYEGAKQDLEMWGRRVRKGGLILVHDATSRFPGVVRALKDWSNDARIEIDWPTRDSLCVIRVKEDIRRSRRMPVLKSVLAPAAI